MTGVVVTGPPRSGTSATARLLDLCGAHVCVAADRVGGGPNNPTGHWESRTVLAANARLLDAAGVRWWCPPSSPLLPDRPSTVTDDAAFRTVHPGDPWLVKDPRFAFTLPHWRCALGDVAAVVVVVRRPDEVVASMRRTWAFDVEHAAALWVRYLGRALGAGADVVPVPFPALAADPTAVLEPVVERLAARGLDLRPPDPASVADFVRRPRGAEESPVGLPSWAWDWWDDLGGAPPAPREPPAVEAVLGRLRAELRAGRPIDTRPVFARREEVLG